MLRETEYGREEVMAGVLKSISRGTRVNSKGTPYFICQVEIKYPDGGTELIGSQLYKALDDAMEGTFMPDAEVEVAIQLDGTYAGYSKVGVPALKRPDISRLKLSYATPTVVEEVNATI